MDPITVLSVASSVVALVDFGGKLVNRSFEISRSPSGQPQDALDILQTSKELGAMAAEARGKVRGLEARYPRHATLIEQINVECADIEKQLTRALERLTVNPSSRGLARASSQVTVTIRSALSSRQLENLSSKIDGIRNRVMMSVIMCLLDEVQETQKNVKTTGKESQSVLEALGRVESKLDSIHSRSTTGNFNAERTARGPMIDTLWTWSELLDLPVQLANPQPGSWSEIKTQEGWKEKILESLAFDGMISRRDRISVAFPNTFKWLFSAEEDSGVNSKASRLFTNWLKSKTEKAFWITGKPASGKSTLMKFIATRPSLMDYLKVWAGEKGLLVAYFYFWGPGTAMEKSWVGLFRSLLYQLLSQRPDLCESVAIRRHALFSVAGIENDSPEWTLPELRECLSRLTSKVQGTSRVALFIDGLDEFDGHHIELASFFKGLQQNHGIKICVSSRPWNDFSDAFRQHPMLRMEGLTKPDLDKYIDARFAQCIALQELEAVNPKSIRTLREAIADRAEGVFLWVAIVIEQIVTKARQTPVLDEIWGIFNSLPADLGALYRKIHDDLDPQMREASSRIYRMVLAWKLHIGDDIDAVHFWLAFNCKDPALPVVFLDVKDHRAIVRPVRRLLAGHTKGLLQTISQGKTRTSTAAIDFLHRTAFDWLQLPEQTQDLRTHSPGFEPLLSIMAVYGGYLRHFIESEKAYIELFDLGNMWARFFHICSQVDYLSASEKTLTSILNQFRFQEDILKEIPAIWPSVSEGIEGIDRWSTLDHLGRLAAAYCCRAYLFARLRADQSYFRTRPHLLEAVVLGIGRDVKLWRKGELDLRLATVNLLIDHGAKRPRRLQKLLRKRDHDPLVPADHLALYHQYWDTVAILIQRRQDPTGNASKSWSPMRFLFNHTRKTLSQATGYAQPRTLEPLTFRDIGPSSIPTITRRDGLKARSIFRVLAVKFRERRFNKRLYAPIWSRPKRSLPIEMDLGDVI